MNIVETQIPTLQRVISTVNDGLSPCVSLLGENDADRLGQESYAPAQLFNIFGKSSMRNWYRSLRYVTNDALGSS